MAIYVLRERGVIFEVEIAEIKKDDLLEIVTYSQIHNPRTWFCLVKKVAGGVIKGSFFDTKFVVEENLESIGVNDIKSVDIWIRNSKRFVEMVSK
jgi:hypothetical protein